MSWSVTATAATGSGARGKLSPCCSPAPASSTASSHDLAAAEILEQIEQEGDLGLVAPGLALPPRGSSLLELQREKYPGRRGPGLGEGTGGATVSKIAQCLWENKT